MVSFKNLAIIFLIATLIVSAILIWPEYQKNNSLSSDIEKADYGISKQEGYFSDLKDLDDEIENKYKDKIALIDYAFPKDPNLPLLYDFVIKTCAQEGLILTGISNSISAESDNEEKGIISINLQVSGSYSNIKDFIYAMENSARIFNVETVSFSSPEEEGSPFNFSLKIDTQFIK